MTPSMRATFGSAGQPSGTIAWVTISSGGSLMAPSNIMNRMMTPLNTRPVHRAPDETGEVSEMLIGVPSGWFEPFAGVKPRTRHGPAILHGPDSFWRRCAPRRGPGYRHSPMAAIEERAIRCNKRDEE